MATGSLVVFEGAEGVGKSTQVEKLLRRFSGAGVQAVSFREPGGTVVGDQIREILLRPGNVITPAAEALLFMASRAELCEREIAPAIAAGKVVVLDRFFLSTYAYQIAGRGLDEEGVRRANRLATGGLVPDLTLLLDYPVMSGLERAGGRGRHDRMEQQDAEFHERIGRAFATFAGDEWSAAHPECGRIVSVDARGTADEVAARISDALADNLPERFWMLREPEHSGLS
ncbi:MAG TPA: dTMP kinase [Gemmatimonadaceae bacterium]|nr:dTMP kinase [Gemmatimonadaceae bacterium]